MIAYAELDRLTVITTPCAKPWPLLVPEPTEPAAAQLRP
jgi:hypothetical protein